MQIFTEEGGNWMVQFVCTSHQLRIIRNFQFTRTPSLSIAKGESGQAGNKQLCMKPTTQAAGWRKTTK